MKTKEPKRWLDIPVKDQMHWFSEWMMASIVLNAWKDKKGQPKSLNADSLKIIDGVGCKCGCKCHRGESSLRYEVKF